MFMQSVIDIAAIGAASLILVGLVWLVLSSPRNGNTARALVERIDDLEAGLDNIEREMQDSILRIVALETRWKDIGDALARIESAVTNTK